MVGVEMRFEQETVVTL